MAMLGYLDDLRRRLACSQRMKLGFDYLAQLTADDFAGIGEGEVRRVEIDGERVFAMNQTYTTSPDRAPKYEAHRRYLDLQFILAGGEAMLVAARRNCRSLAGHDDDKDVEFFHPPVGPESRLEVAAGMVAVFYPEDVHAPCLLAASGGTVKVFKSVVKVEL